MLLKEALKIFDLFNIKSEFEIQLNNKISTLYDIEQLPENTKIKSIEIKIMNKRLKKENIIIYTLYESNVDLSFPENSNYTLISFNFITK